VKRLGEENRVVALSARFVPGRGSRFNLLSGKEMKAVIGMGKTGKGVSSAKQG
jgi:hypothetical protein